MQTKGDKRIAGDIKIAVYGIFGINTAGVIVGNYLDRRVGRVARVRELLAS